VGRATRDALIGGIERVARNTAIAAALGPGVVQPFEQPSMGAKDFTHFVAPSFGVPGYYFAVGGTPQAVIDAAGAGGPPLPPHHSPLFRIEPEPAVRTGAEAMVAAAQSLLL
jgi:hippurate hydrolase